MASDSNQLHAEDKKQLLENALPLRGTVLSGYVLDSKGRTTSHRTKEYRIKSVLGAGGFGITYKVSAKITAGNIEIETDFAIKEHFMKGCYRGSNGMQMLYAPTMRSEIEQSREDFITEAHRLNRLSIHSPNIVKVNEVFTANDTVYYVMEYLNGGDMIKYLRDNGGPLSEGKALSLLLPIAKAVELLHREHLLHLDIKPDNIVLKKDPSGSMDVPVLIDFGIAKHFNSSGRPTSRVVAKGASDGYAPMEQYAGIDHFAPEIDVYALGATLYYLLTGKNPPKAFDISSTSQLRASLPQELSERVADTIAAAMQPNRYDRTPTVQAFLSSIEKSYTLPIGYVLSAHGHSFRVVEILTENLYSITYKAIEVHSLTGKGREAYSGVQTVVPEHYVIMEAFDKSRHQRMDDGRVSLRGGSRPDFSDFTEDIVNKSKNPLHQVMEFYGDEYGLSWQFVKANNTLYYIYNVVPKPSILARLKESVPAFFRLHGKKIIVAAVAAVVVYGGIRLFRPSHLTKEAMLTKAINNNDEGALLSLINDSGYSAAIAPLAKLYSSQGDNAKALDLLSQADSTSNASARELQKTIVGDSIRKINAEIENIVGSLPDVIDQRVAPLASARKMQEQALAMAQVYAIPYQTNRKLQDAIDADFNEWVGFANLLEKKEYYENALKLKEDSQIRQRYNRL